MKSSHTERGTTYSSHRHRPGQEPTHAESKTPERAVEDSHRGAISAQLPPQTYGHAGDFKRSPPHEAEGRIGTDHRPTEVPSPDRGSASTAEAEAERRQHTGAPLK